MKNVNNESFLKYVCGFWEKILFSPIKNSKEDPSKVVSSSNNTKNTIWVITDTHLGHEKMVQFCGRPKNHSEIILKNLSKTLKTGDTLIHLGDVCLGDDIGWHHHLAGHIPAGVKRILIKGNHDSKSSYWYQTHGWDFVLEQFTDTFYGKRITFSHIPIPGINHMNIHGHFHNNLHRMDDETKRWYDPVNHKLLEIESLGLRPVSLKSLIK